MSLYDNEIPPPSTMTVDDKPKPKVVLYDAHNKPLVKAVPRIGFVPPAKGKA